MHFVSLDEMSFSGKGGFTFHISGEKSELYLKKKVIEGNDAKDEHRLQFAHFVFNNSF